MTQRFEPAIDCGFIVIEFDINTDFANISEIVNRPAYTNKIILAMCNDMLINEFLYDVDDTDAYEYYNECIYKSFNADIKIIEDWVNNNNVSKVHIWATNKTYDEHAYNADGYIEDAKYQEFMKTCSLTN